MLFYAVCAILVELVFAYFYSINLEYNRIVVLRMMVFFAIFISLGYFWITDNKHIKDYLKHPTKENYFIVGGMVVICFFHFILTAFNIFSENMNYFRLLIFIIPIIMVAGLNGINVHGFNDKIIKNRFSIAPIYILVLFVLVYPTISQKYINAESYIKDFHNTTENQDYANLTIKLSKNDYHSILGNMSKPDIEGLLGRSKLENNNGNYFFKTSILNLSSVCLLVDRSKYLYGYYQDEYGTYKKCAFEFKKIRSYEDLKNTTNNFIFYNNAKEALLDIAEEKFTKFFSPKHQILASDPGFDIALIRGGIFHHFHSIGRSLFTDNISSFFLNQYGFGPSAIISLVKNTFNLKIFDSIYISTLVVNVLLFFAVLASVNKCSNSKKTIIWLGFSFGILITYLLSGMMAPMLYYIRFLPTILLALLVYKASVNKTNDNRIFRTIFLVLVIIISLYNFEYALITLASTLIAGIITRDKFQSFVSVIGLILSLVPNLLITNTAENLYPVYLSGVYMTGYLSPVATLFFLVATIVFFRIVAQYRRVGLDKHALTLAILAYLLTIKVVWSGAGNHIGPLFLIYAMIVERGFYSSNGSRGVYANYGINIIKISCILVLIISILTSAKQKLNTKINGINYMPSIISDFYLIDEDLNHKLTFFESNYKKGDIVISPIDSALSIVVNSDITYNLPDFSTNINSAAEARKLVNSFTGKNRILTDKSIFINELDYINYYKGTTKYNDKLMKRISNRLKYNFLLSTIYREAIKNKYYKCDENKYFIILCK